MMRYIRSNKVIFYALMFVWFLAGTVIFNYSAANATSRTEAQESYKYIRIFTQVVQNLRFFYVEDLNFQHLIELAIDNMIENVDTDSTFVRSSAFRNYKTSREEEVVESHRNITGDLNRNLRHFQEVLLLMKSHFGTAVSYKDLIGYAIDGMLDDVDPHTNFFDPKDFQEFTNNTMGEFGGLGITIDRQGDYVTVVSPIEGTPAYRMGIIAGDRIVSVDNENVIGMATEDVIKRMRGDKGTRVLIGIERFGVPDVLFFDIVRDIIKIKSVPYAFKLDNGVGYIRIRTFNANTTTELRQALNLLEAQNIRGLLIDLRFNPGGLLNEAVDTVNEFIGPNKLVVFTKGRMRQANFEHFTRFNRSRSDYPVVVLINEASASASEIFAGSMQDWDRGLVVGRPSFGKGSVQQLFPLDEGYGMKVTISKYYIKSGRCIHKDLLDRLLRGHDISEEEVEAIERESREKIYHTVNGREVRGGGGIVPDIDLPQTVLTRMERDIRRMNLLQDFSIDYFTKNKDNIETNFVAYQSLIDDFLEFGISRGLEFEPADLDSSHTFIRLSLTKDIIDKKFGEVEGYRAAIALDSQLVEAISLFDHFTTTEEMFQYALRRKERE